MKNYRSLWIIITAITIFVAGCNQSTGNTTANNSAANSVKSDAPQQEFKPNPQLTEENKKAMKDEVRPVCPDGARPVVGFSVYGNSRTQGQDTILTYQNAPITDTANAWRAQSMYIVPCSGLYVLTLNIMKDSFNGGTSDDVTAYITITDNSSIAAIPGAAWSGNGTARGPGTLTVTKGLKKDQIIQTWVSSSNRLRDLPYYSLTGYLISQ